MKYIVMLLILTGFVGMAHASQDEATHSTGMTFEEHYEIEILGLEDEYSTVEEYSFDFVISGYGHGCANYQVSYPDGNGLLVGTGAQSLCAAQTSMYEFEIKSFDRHGTLGNVVIEKPGTYAVTVTFEKPSKYFPTIVNKEFRVVESISRNFNELTPLKQFKSGVAIDGIHCRESFILIPKHDSSPACVKPETISKLIERGWATQSLVQDIVMKTMSKKLGPECSQNTMDEIMSGKTVDEKCATFMDELFTKRQSEMVQKGYAFDQESKSWIKEGYPDMLMNIADYYQQNLKSSKITHESESESLDIASIEDRYIHLNPADMCATISLELMSPDELEQIKLGTKDGVFLELADKDIEEMSILGELIRATHHLEFPSNEYAHAKMGMGELVDYEFFIMEKAIEKYVDSKEDYFIKLDPDLDNRLADPKKQGFSNEFIAPQIVYDDNVYVLGHTVFWVSDEHEMQSMSVHLKENLNESKKFVTLNDEDMESIPKIREAVTKIGTELESVVAFKGVPENPDWNDYREWYADKSAEQFGTDDVHVRGFIYENKHYDLGFLIC